MKMENKRDDEKDRPEEQTSRHPDLGHSEDFRSHEGLVPDDIGDTNELVDESAHVRSKQLTT